MTNINDDFTKLLGEKVSRLRVDRGISLTGFAKKAGISKALLSVIESGKGNPTISTVWNIASALDLSFGNIVDFSNEKEKKVLEVEENGIFVRLIEQNFELCRMETYLMEFPKGSVRKAKAHPFGVREKLMVLKGQIVAGSKSESKLVELGETFEFNADEDHFYYSLDQESTAVVSVIYPKLEKKVGEFSRIISQHDLPEAEKIFENSLYEVMLGFPMLRLIFEKTDQSKIIFKQLKKIFEKEFCEKFFSLTVFFTENNEDFTIYILGVPPVLNLDMEFKSVFEKVNKEHDSYFNDKYKYNDDGFKELFNEILKPNLFSELEYFCFHKNKKFFPFVQYLNPNIFDFYKPGIGCQAGHVLNSVAEHTNVKAQKILCLCDGEDYNLLILASILKNASFFSFGLSKRPLENTDYQNVTFHESLDDFEPGSFKTAVLSLETGNTEFVSLLKKAEIIIEDNGLLIVTGNFISDFLSEEEKKYNLIQNCINNIKISLFMEYRINPDFMFLPDLGNLIFDIAEKNHQSALIDVKEIIDLLSQIPFKTFVFANCIAKELKKIKKALLQEKINCTFKNNFLCIAALKGFHLLETRGVFMNENSTIKSGGRYVFVFKKR